MNQETASIEAIEEEPLALTSDERYFLSWVAEDSLQVYKRHQFFLWTQGVLQSLLPHEILICGIADPSGSGMKLDHFATTRYFREEHFRAICHPVSGLMTQIMTQLRKVKSPCLIAPGSEWADKHPEWVGLVDQNELRNIAAHGIRGADGKLAAFFSFSRVTRELNLRTAYMLEILTPYLYATYSRVEEGNGKMETGGAVKIRHSISSRETEILRMVKDGKTNKDIARLLNLSPCTVKNHMQKVLKKLSVKTRSHAVARAINVGILTSEGI